MGVNRTAHRWLAELRSWPTLVVLTCCVFVGVPLVVLLNPDQQLQVLGQTIGVGARAPQLSVRGPAEVVQIGNTDLDLSSVQVFGPLRPRLSLGPIQRGEAAAQALDPDRSAAAAETAVHTVVEGFVRWFLWGALGMVLAALAISALAAWLRMLLVLRRQHRSVTDPEVLVSTWRRLSGSLARMTVIAVVGSLVVWTAGGALASAGTVQGLARVHSLTDLVGATRVTPSAVGPPVQGYTAAVIGDSRAARVGGPPVPDPSPDDQACERSSDSLAVQLGRIESTRVLNLACSGASTSVGLLGTQLKGERRIPAQVGRLKQVRGLKTVVVAIGPNDLSWTDFLQYCYGLSSCDDRLSAGEFTYRMAEFDQQYAQLLAALNDLPGPPRVVVLTSYDPFGPDAGPRCPDFRGPSQYPGLNRHKIDLLDERNAALNEVLRTGARKYGFAVAAAQLTPLCETPPDGLGPDLQGLADAHPFHPTAVGSLRLAAAAAAATALR